MWPRGGPSESTASLVSDATTIVADSHDTSGLSEEKPSEGECLCA